MRGRTDDLGDSLRDLFTRHIVEDDRMETNYSLSISDDPTVFHALYRGSCVAVTSPDAERVVTALVRHISCHGPAPAGTVPVQAIALIRGGRATLLPTLLEDDVRALSHRLGAEGIQLLDTHTVHVDLGSREVVVGSHIDVEGTALERILSMAPARKRRDPPVADGRYPLDRWRLMEIWERPGPYSRATATRRAALVLRGGPLAAGPDSLERLASLFETVRAEGIDPSSRQETLALARSWL